MELSKEVLGEGSSLRNVCLRSRKEASVADQWESGWVESRR